MIERVRLNDCRERLARVRLDEPKAKVVRERLHDDAPKAKAKRGIYAKRRTMQLTEARIAGLRINKAGPYWVWDHGNDAQRGLAVMVLPSGRKTYTAHFNYPNQKTRSMAIGTVGEVSLEAARKRTAEIRVKAKLGLDPRADDPTRSLTFGELVKVWHEREQTGRKANVSADATRKLVEFHTKAKFWNRPTGTIRYQELDDLLTVLRDDKKQGATAARLFSHLASIFKWAVTTRRLAANPMQGMPPPCKVQRREFDWFKAPRSDEVLRDLWQLAGELGGDAEKFIKLLVLTGKRRGAVQAMRWEHIVQDDDGWYWNPPQHLFSKQKRFSPIPLPKLAQRILGKRPEDSGRVMNMPESRVQPLLNQVRKKLEADPDPQKRFEAFLWHGIRHVFETRTGELGVLPHVRDLLLDHAIARSATGRGYDHSTYRAALLEALEKWADHVENLVRPGKGNAANVAVLR